MSITGQGWERKKKVHHPTFFLLALPADKTAILSYNSAPDACFSLFVILTNFCILINQLQSSSEVLNSSRSIEPNHNIWSILSLSFRYVIRQRASWQSEQRGDHVFAYYPTGTSVILSKAVHAWWACRVQSSSSISSMRIAMNTLFAWLEVCTE